MKILSFLFMKALSWSLVNHHASSNNINSVSMPRTIPGGANFTFCPESRSTDLYKIEEIEVAPHWPPKIGEYFLITAYGTFLKDISENATWYYDAWRDNWEKHLNGTTAFCNTMDSIEQPDPDRKQGCPPEKGFALISVYWEIPDGWLALPEDTYHFHFDAKTKDGERIYCIENTFYLDWPEGKGPDHLTSQPQGLEVLNFIK